MPQVTVGVNSNVKHSVKSKQSKRLYTDQGDMVEVPAWSPTHVSLPLPQGITDSVIK